MAEKNETVEALTGYDLDRLMYNCTTSEWRRPECALYSTKWFDYRFLHPFEATCLYIEQYGRIFREKYAGHLDRKSANFVKVPKVADIIDCHDDPQMKRTITGCWRGRQVADGLGIPYDVFIRLAIDERMRFWRRKYMPQSFQLYSPEVIEGVDQQWEIRRKGRLYYSTHENYRNERYVGTPAQNQHHEWLFEQAYDRKNPPSVIARFVEENLLPIEKVEARLTAEELERVQSYL